MSSDAEKGLMRRPPTLTVGSASNLDALYEKVEIDSVEYIFELLSNGTMMLYEEDGTAHRVLSEPGVANYLGGTDRISTLSFDGSVHIVNPNMKVKMEKENKYYSKQDGIIFLLGGQYGRKYTVTVTYGDKTASVEYTTPDGSQSSHGPLVATDRIAGELETRLRTALPDFTVTRRDDIILIRHNNGDLDTFDIQVSDGDGGINLFGVTDYSGDVGKLPRFAPHNHYIKLTGADSAYDDEWYVRFDKENESSSLDGTGVWVECVERDSPYRFDATTMPHILRKSKDEEGFFELVPGEWKERRVGDDKTNPLPEFVDDYITDIAIFQGRLVFLSGSYVTMSRTNKMDDMWKNSATDLVDTDPISITSASDTSAPVMKRAIPHNRDLVIFSSTAQFVVFGRNAITPRNTQLVLTTSYEANLDATPVSAGQNIFYAMEYGDATGIREFYTDGDSDINMSSATTAHCTNYIKGSARLLASTTNFEMLLVKTDGDPHKVYVYEYIWIDNEKMQSAWSTWTFDNEVLFFTFVGDSILFVNKCKDGTKLLQKMRLDRQPRILPFEVHLDNQDVYTGVRNAINIPPFVNNEGLTVVQADGCPEPGMSATIKRVTRSQIILEDDLRGGSVLVGNTYKSSVVLTKPVIKDREDRAITTGSLSVYHFEVLVKESGFLKGTIRYNYKDPSTIERGPRIVSSSGNDVGYKSIRDYVATIPFMADVENATLEIHTDRYTPLRVITVNWKGSYIQRGSFL